MATLDKKTFVSLLLVLWQFGMCGTWSWSKVPQDALIWARTLQKDFRVHNLIHAPMLPIRLEAPRDTKLKVKMDARRLLMVSSLETWKRTMLIKCRGSSMLKARTAVALLTIEPSTHSCYMDDDDDEGGIMGLPSLIIQKSKCQPG